MAKATVCPYCGGEHFNGWIPADTGWAQLPSGRYVYPEREVVGDWFNRCVDCEGWSLYCDEPEVGVDCKQVRLPNPKVTPAPAEERARPQLDEEVEWQP